MNTPADQFPGCVPIHLSPEDVKRAVRIGAKRRADSMSKGQRDKFAPGSFPDQIVREVAGAAGELAIANLCGVPWSESVGTYRNEPDVTVDGEAIEVRWSERRDVKIARNDRPDQYVAAVRGFPPVMIFVGWIRAEDGQRDQFEKDPGGYGKPAFFVPYANLAPGDAFPLIC